MSELTICPFTDQPIVIHEVDGDSIYYEIKIQDETYPVTFCRKCFETIKELGDKTIIAGLILNYKIGNNLERKIHWDQGEMEIDRLSLSTIIEDGDYPISPKEKLDNLFMGLYKIADFDGQGITMVADQQNVLWYKYYFENVDELKFYLDVLVSNNLIVEHGSKMSALPTGHIQLTFTCRLTFKGLNKASELEEEGDMSNNCFVAMSFNHNTLGIRNAIREALKETGFIPIIIDEQLIDSDRTINDEIIAGLRKCKFCIADFTNQSRGVYFESGFVVGQSKKVIYTCERKDFENAHFDIKPLQHIIYETPEELKKELVYKIQAWII